MVATGSPGLRTALGCAVGGTELPRFASEDYGTGPFRRLAFDEKGGEQLGLSDNFSLPEHRLDVVVVLMKPLGQD